MNRLLYKFIKINNCIKSFLCFALQNKLMKIITVILFRFLHPINTYVFATINTVVLIATSVKINPTPTNYTLTFSQY